MRLDDEQVRAAYFCAAEALRNRRENGYPIPDALHRLYNRLDIVLTSRPGHEIDCTGEQLAQNEYIGASEAGRILGVSKRQAQRLAADLDGQLASGRWIFVKSVVEQYAEQKRNHAKRGPDQVSH